MALAPVERGEWGAAEGWLALEFLQYTGTFKARGAFNFIRAHREAGTLPEAGAVIASGGNAGLACAWAAAQHSVPATVFVPETAPVVKVDRLRRLGAAVHQIGTEYADARDAAQKHAAETGALLSHAYDHPLIAAGAGTVMEEILQARPDLDTVVVAVGGGGLFTGVAVSALERGVRVVAVEPYGCRALNAALEAGAVVDVPVDSVAADSLGARHVSSAALEWARKDGVRSVLVSDEAIVSARQALWDDRRIAV
ncbi:pyridoxal-phosphate dependent enzyme, partial [Streptomyces albiflaviniger]|nr:pyridoxal-phosphate dependent enzyme [Streptomyces albiflaviniger]